MLKLVIDRVVQQVVVARAFWPAHQYQRKQELQKLDQLLRRQSAGYEPSDRYLLRPQQ